MRSGLFCLLLLAVCSAPAAAQSALDGPLAAPDSPRPAAHLRAKAKPARHAKAKPAAPIDTAGSAAAVPAAAPVMRTGPDDRVSLGMKWQGSNDSAAQTRFRNLDGNAFGSGAEVGMKLHF